MAKQHRNPCSTCPFTRKSDPGETGGSPTEVYIAQTLMPYWVPCHECIDYSDPDWKTKYETQQCVGHAMMRDKMGVADKMPEPLLRVAPTEQAQVFDSLTQMYAYHEGITEEEAASFLTPNVVNAIIQYEINKTSAGFMKPEELTKKSNGET